MTATRTRANPAPTLPWPRRPGRRTDADIDRDLAAILAENVRRFPPRRTAS